MKIVNFVGYSGSGKTTLIEKVIALLSQQGFKVAAIKNAHHGFEMDKPGKDSYRFRQAGASQIIVRSDDRWAMLTETPQRKPTLKELVSHLDAADIVVVEGFKSEEGEALRLEVWRDLGRVEEPVSARDKRIAAVVTDTTHKVFEGMRIFDINDPESLTQFIVKELNVKAE